MGVSKVMHGYRMFDPVAMKFFDCSTAVFDEFSFGAKELIIRVSGNPEVVPGEWIRALQEEWEEKYKESELADKDQEFEEGYMKPEKAEG